MKKVFLAVGFTIVAHALQAQTSITFPSSSTTPPNGTQIPNVTFAQRTSITNLTPGLLVYQTDNDGSATAGLYVYTSTGWIKTNTNGGIDRNATLVGDGTAGSPLGINLSNSNTWTGNQTFGGTFLITSNSRIAMTNSDNRARDIRFQEPSGTGSQYVGLEAPSVSDNSRYVFPPAVGPVGSALTVSNTFAANDGSTDKTNLVWSTSMPPSGAAGGDLTGTYPNPTIAADAVTTAHIATGAVITSKIASNAVSTGKIDGGAVTEAKIANGAVTTAKINSTGAASGQVLTYNGSNVVWASPASSSSPTVLSASGTVNFDAVQPAGSTFGSRYSTTTISVPNAVDGDAVSVGVLNSGMYFGLMFQGWVESAGQVRIRVINAGQSTVPAFSTTVQVRVIK